MDDLTHEIEQVHPQHVFISLNLVANCLQQQIPGFLAVHELHNWCLDQKKSLASAHIVLSDKVDIDFKVMIKTINECFHAYGIHSVTLQPELVDSGTPPSETLESGTVRVTIGQSSNSGGDTTDVHKYHRLIIMRF